MPVYLNTTEAGRILSLCSRQVANLCASGRLGQKIGRNWAITPDQVEEFKKIPRPVGVRLNSK